MEKIIGLRELRENVSRYSTAVQSGKSFIVVRKSKPLFRIAPIEDGGQWELVADFTKIKKGGVIIDELLRAL